MDFADALRAMREGKKVRRPEMRRWHDALVIYQGYLYKTGPSGPLLLVGTVLPDHILATDWEIVDE